MSAVAQDLLALQYATEEMQGDREVVMAVVAQDGMYLADASEEMQRRP